MVMFEKVSLFDYDVYSGTRAALVEEIGKDISQGKCNVVFAINPLKVILANDDISIKKVLQDADILIPDGAGILYSAKRKKHHIKERITGIDLMNDICGLAADIKAPIFIYGAVQENLEHAVKNLEKIYPDIKIAGYINGYEKDISYVNRLINESGARILFVACGSPMQEKYIYDNKSELRNVNFFLGVGGSIDVMSGNVKRAPGWIRRINMEWLYRAVLQPKRFSNLKKLIKFFCFSHKF